MSQGDALLDLEPHVVDAAEAQAMTRQQAIRTLAASGDRMGQIMLAGPVISDADAQRLRSFRPRATRPQPRRIGF